MAAPLIYLRMELSIIRKPGQCIHHINQVYWGKHDAWSECIPSLYKIFTAPLVQQFKGPPPLTVSFQQFSILCK